MSSLDERGWAGALAHPLGMRPATTVRVLVVEPELSWQRSIRDACADEGSVQFVGFAQRPDAGVALARAAAPDVIVYDPTGVPPPEAIEAVHALQRAGGAAVVLFASKVDGFVAASAESTVPRHRPELLARTAISLVGRPPAAGPRR
jgi:DNA-binding NarL/FixJ family response regulator